MIIIKNANLISMAEVNYEKRDIVIEGSKIIDIQSNIDVSNYPNATIINAKKKFVTPGIVDPHCHIGIMEEIIKEGNDTNEMTNPIFPELRAIDGINPADGSFKSAVEDGITTVVVGPGSANPIGGTFTIMKTHGNTMEDMVIVEESAMKMALGENPKRVYGSKDKTPQTRMGTAALIRESLIKAKDYYQKQQEYLKAKANNQQDAKQPEFNMKLHSLMRVFDGMLVKIHAHRADDIMTAIRIKEEFNLNLTIEHCTEGHLVADKLAKYNVGAIIGPTLTSKSKPEVANKTFKSGKILSDNKVQFAIMTDHPVICIEDTLLQVGRFVREGLEELEALRAVTKYAAQINNIDSRVGTIEVGKDADILIWSNHPLNHMAKPEYVLINGEIIVKK
ncbi:MAG TPA: amidohydrolase [Bacilli bacterium]|nr:amidohydrolase [Bacilli bacterium]